MKITNPKNPTPKIEATNEQKWQAILNRDARMDGVFFTGVLTTKIYCRPSCPAKTPLRKNVNFLIRQAKQSEQAYGRVSVVILKKRMGKRKRFKMYAPISNRIWMIR